MNMLDLSNGYQLAWNKYGESNGEAIFYFHGLPGSRLEAQAADAIANDLGIQLICPERPGYGDSNLLDNFRLLDWPAVVSQLADKLNLERISILGFSVGCNYALACAHSIPKRLSKISLIGGLAPYQTEVMQNQISADFKPLYDLSLADENAALQQVTQMGTSPEDLFNIIQSALPPCDKTLFEQRKIKSHFKNSIHMAIKNGVLGCVSDILNLTRPWQFSLTDINLPIDIWHGREDKSVGFAIGEYLASELKNSTFHPQDNCGHYFLFDKWFDVLKSVKKGAI